MLDSMFKFHLGDRVRLIEDHVFNGLIIHHLGGWFDGEITVAYVDSLSEPKAFYGVNFNGHAVTGLTEDQLEFVA